MTTNKTQIFNVIDQYASRFKDISSYIGAHPELGNEEYLASARLKEELSYHGFKVQAPILGLETAFIGTYASSKPGPTIALLCEYDALPEIGHACGHHLICMMSLGGRWPESHCGRSRRNDQGVWYTCRGDTRG